MITTITLNTSIDKAYYMDSSIENGTVMRVASCKNSAGGKGLNVARIVKLCKGSVQASGFVGGYNGAYLEALLDADGIPHDFEHVDGETRCCINILEPKFGSTEYLEPGCEVSQAEENRFMQRLPDIIKDSAVVTISGSIPQGVDSGIYERIVERIKIMGKKVILDTSGDALKKGIRACPDMIKPNKDEMMMLLGREIHSIKDVIRCAQELHDLGIPYVVVSLGKDGALLVCSEGIFMGITPDVKVVNTVGCGDSMVGAFAVAMEKSYAPGDALKYAVAVSTANALSPNTGDFDPEICEELLTEVTVERI